MDKSAECTKDSTRDYFTKFMVGHLQYLANEREIARKDFDSAFPKVVRLDNEIARIVANMCEMLK
jgi:hypothetical protein